MFSWNTRIIYNKGFEDQVTMRSDEIHDKKGKLKLACRMILALIEPQ